MTDSRALDLRATLASVGGRVERLLSDRIVPFPMRAELIMIARACKMAIEDDERAEERERKSG